MRLFAYAHREALELRRDPIRLTFALLGSVLLMFILGYGITMDVEDLRFAALDRDRTPQSRDYIQNLAGSRYFIERPFITDDAELDRRMRSAELSVAIEIPSGFGRDLKRGRQTEVGVWVDGASPFRGETIKGYVQGMHYQYLADLARRTYGAQPQTGLGPQIQKVPVAEPLSDNVGTVVNWDPLVDWTPSLSHVFGHVHIDIKVIGAVPVEGCIGPVNVVLTGDHARTPRIRRQP